MMIALGLVAQVLHTRLWLLFPAIRAFLAALAMGAFIALSVEIFGALWLLSLTGVGLVLCAGRGTQRRPDVGRRGLGQSGGRLNRQAMLAPS